MKPSFKDYTYGSQFKKGYKVSDVDEVRKLYARIKNVQSDLTLQEWIDGPDWNIFFCLQYRTADGRPVSSFVGRKIRSWPPEVGGTASCTAATDHCEAVERLTNDFFQTVGFVGMGSMEFKLHERTGELFMVEPTVSRTDYQEEVATLNGVNIPLACYRAESGLPSPAETRGPHPVIWRDPVGDRWSAQLQVGSLPPWASNGSTRDAYWRYWDPMPWLSLMNSRIVEYLKIRGRRLRRFGARNSVLSGDDP